MTFILRTACALSVACLAACGGNGTTSAVDDVTSADGAPAIAAPLASSGYATASDTTYTGQSFRLPVTRGLDVDGADTSQTVPVDVVVTFSDDGETAVFTINGIEVETDRSGSDSFSGTNADGNGAEFLIFEESAVAPAWLAATGVTFAGDDRIVIALSPFGFDTDPDTIAARSGSVSYAGEVVGALVGPSGGQFFGAEITLTVGFNGDPNVSGAMTLDSDSFDDPFFDGELVIELNETAISGNGFSGTASLATTAALDPGHSMSDATYDGTFFGVDGQAIGGTMGATFTHEGGDVTELQSGYLADQE